MLNSKHLRGLRKGKKAWCSNQNNSGRKQSTREKNGGQDERKGVGRVEYLPVEWHTRFKGRLYREAGGGVSANVDGESGAREQKRGGGGERLPDRRGNSGMTEGLGGVKDGQGTEEDVLVGGEGGDGEVRGVSAGGLSIWDITLPRAPTLRAFTNDTLLDILYFMSPEYHQASIHTWYIF